MSQLTHLSHCGKTEPPEDSRANLQAGKRDVGRESGDGKRPRLRAVLQKVRNHPKKLVADLGITSGDMHERQRSESENIGQTHWRLQRPSCTPRTSKYRLRVFKPFHWIFSVAEKGQLRICGGTQRSGEGGRVLVSNPGSECREGRGLEK